MSTAQIGAVLIVLAALVASTHLVGYVFERFRQPRLIGEIAAGILFGPFVLGKLAPAFAVSLFGAGDQNVTPVVLSFIDRLGLLFLMFSAGSAARRVLASENRGPTGWLLAVGTPLPFSIALAIGTLLPIEALNGPAGQRWSTILVLAIAVSVTSIPIISRIFHDLGILHTRFASLILGAAILEDIALWAVLAVATALAKSATLGGDVARTISSHIGATVGYMVISLLVLPPLIKRMSAARWNVFAQSSPVGYVIFLMLAYAGVAAALDVNIVFSAFLAGFGLVGGFSGSERDRFAEPLASVNKVSFGLFIPVYFFMVGYRLEFGKGFSLALLALFLVGSSLVCFLSIAIAARLAGFRGLDVINLAVVSNARGGPGIVLASVAYEAGIINGQFFTTLVVTAILTSQAAGYWLGFVLRRKWPLLSGSDLARLNAAQSRAPDGALEPSTIA